MRGSLCVLAVLLLASWALALTGPEEKAVFALMESLPNLRLQPYPWLNDSTKICDHDLFEGLTCSDGPDKHIIGLYEALFSFGFRDVKFPTPCAFLRYLPPSNP